MKKIAESMGTHKKDKGYEPTDEQFNEITSF